MEARDNGGGTPPEFLEADTGGRGLSRRELLKGAGAVGIAIAVPAGFTTDNLPAGITFMGRPYEEGTILKLAYGYEQATHHRKPPQSTPALPGEP